MFTGRWPHELSAGWMTPLDRAHPTVAEHLRSRGYATAGFVGNTQYCGWDSGLARGFTTYRDYRLPRLSAFRLTVLVDRIMAGILATEQFLEEWLLFDQLWPATQTGLAALRGRSQEGRRRQPRIPRLAGPRPATGTAVLRIPEPLRRPQSLRVEARRHPSLRGQAAEPARGGPLPPLAGGLTRAPFR